MSCHNARFFDTYRTKPDSIVGRVLTSIPVLRHPSGQAGCHSEKTNPLSLVFSLSLSIVPPLWIILTNDSEEIWRSFRTEAYFATF